jgi:hypothetical protein
MDVGEKGLQVVADCGGWHRGRIREREDASVWGFGIAKIRYPLTIPHENLNGVPHCSFLLMHLI